MPANDPGPVVSREDQAAALRHRWRADLREINGDTFGASIQRQLADATGVYNAAKAEWIHAGKPGPESGTYGSYMAALAKMDELRTFFRSQVQANVTPGVQIAVLNNFSEPSDDELLGDAS